MWLGKGESSKSSLSVPLWPLKQEWVPEAPSIILHCYLRDKSVFTRPLLTTRDSRKLVILLFSLYGRKDRKMRLGLVQEENYSTVSTSISCTVLVLPCVYLPCCLFSKLLSSRRKFVLFCCEIMRSLYAMNFPMRIALTTSHEFWYTVFLLQFSK